MAPPVGGSSVVRDIRFRFKRTTPLPPRCGGGSVTTREGSTGSTARLRSSTGANKAPGEGQG